jgi:hypothetical protein
MAVGLVLALACGKTRAGRSTPGPAWSDEAASSALLAAVPADTPYFIGNLRAVPDDFWKWLRTFLVPMGAAISPLFASGEADVSPELRKELGSLFTPEGLERAGIGGQLRLALYGIGLWPALRLDLADPDAFRRFVARLEELVGRRLPTAQLGGQTYWRVSDDKALLAMAVVGRHLVVGVTATRLADDVLPVLLGQRLPARTLAQRQLLAQLMREHHYLPNGIGFIDFDHIARMLLRPTGELERGLAALLGTLQAGPACAREIEALVARAPRLVFGYSELSANRVAGSTVVELAPPLAAALADLHIAMAGFADQPRGAPLFTFGLALHIDKAIAFAEDVLAAHAARRYECPALTALGREAAELQGRLDDALPPFFPRGPVGVYGEFASGDFSGDTPRDLRGHVLLHVAGASALLTMARMAIPAIAALPLQNDGKPVRVPLDREFPGISVAHLARRGDTFALSLGPGMESRLPELLAEKADGPAPILAFSYSPAGLLRQQLDQALARSEPHMRPLLQATMNTIARLPTLAYSLRFEKNGIVLRFSMPLR